MMALDKFREFVLRTKRQRIFGEITMQVTYLYTSRDV